MPITHKKPSAGGGGGVTDHDSLTGVSTDDHHAEVHDIDGAKHNGFPGGTANFLRADGTFAAPPAGGGDVAVVGALVGKSTAQTIGDFASTYVTFNSETFDTDALHDNVTNNSRLTVPAGMAGKWLVGYTVTWVEKTTSEPIRLLAQIEKNRGGVYARADDMRAVDVTGAPDHFHTLNGSSIIDAAAGDYFEVAVLIDYNSNFVAGAGTLDVGGNAATTFWAVYLGGTGPGKATYVFASRTKPETGISRRMYADRDGSIDLIYPWVSDQAPTSTLTLDVLKNGTSIFPSAAKPSIAAAGFLGADRVPDTVAFVKGDKLEVEIENLGGVTQGRVFLAIKFTPS